MTTLKSVVAEELREEGFGVKITDGGVIAYLGSRKPSHHELVDAVPELEGCPMEKVNEGTLIQAEDEPFSASRTQEGAGSI
jgi:hypothetical protein